jgi:hypothetical protein
MGLPGLAVAQQPSWQTWHPWQLDSVLVAWVLAQGLPAAPAFESVTRGTAIPAERAIDTPDSPYRRTGQRTAFDEAVRLTDLKHHCVPKLREAVRIVELAAWRKPEFPGAEDLEARVLRATPQQPARDVQPVAGGLDAAFSEIERYCREGR